MISFPNCKINLGLQITGKRADGYHNLETIFYPIPLKEAIELIPSENFQFHTSGLDIPGENENNLCVKAYHILQKDYSKLPPVNIWLHKIIPTGAGLGGGSADAAFMLKLINKSFKLGLSDHQLMGYAAQLGSDCPFFILNKPCFAYGRGEILEPIDLDLSAYNFILVHPQKHIGTSWAFSQITPFNGRKSLKTTILQPMSTWAHELKNDFEDPVLNLFPELKTIKDKLYESGALYASMTGSGSTFYGIFKKNSNPVIKFDQSYTIYFI